MTNSIAEIEDAACLFIIGSNTSEAHPLIAHRVFKAHDKGAKIIVVDPRRIQVAQIADASLDDVVKTTVYLKDMNDFARVNEVYGRYFTKLYPARVCVAVKELPEGADIEMDAILAVAPAA